MTPKGFAYPMSWILDFPEIPSQYQMGHLREAFLSSYANHTFLGALPLAQPLRDFTVPPFRLAVACLGALQSGQPEKEARNLCSAGINLWAAMTEIDNREARSLEMLLSVSLPIGLPYKTHLKFTDHTTR